MKYDVLPLTRLIEQFARLPGIGRKTAQRLAFYVLNLPKDKAQEFANAILEAHEKIRPCAVCQNLTDREVCQIAPTRTATTAPSAWWRARATSWPSSAPRSTAGSTTCCRA